MPFLHAARDGTDWPARRRPRAPASAAADRRASISPRARSSPARRAPFSSACSTFCARQQPDIDRDRQVAQVAVVAHRARRQPRGCAGCVDVHRIGDHGRGRIGRRGARRQHRHRIGDARGTASGRASPTWRRRAPDRCCAISIVASSSGSARSPTMPVRDRAAARREMQRDVAAIVDDRRAAACAARSIASSTSLGHRAGDRRHRRDEDVAVRPARRRPCGARSGRVTTGLDLAERCPQHGQLGHQLPAGCSPKSRPPPGAAAMSTPARRRRR